MRSIRAPRRTAPQPLPLTLDRRRIYILPTGQGLVFLLMLGAMLLGAVNYQNNLAFLMTFLLAGVALASLIHCFRNLIGITVSAISPTPVFAGQTARFAIRLAPGAQPRFAIQLALSETTAGPCDLTAHMEAGLEIGLVAERRGLMQPDRLVVFTRYPMGLFRAWAPLQPQVACLVYPSPLASSLPLGQSSAADGNARRQPAQTDDFQGFTPYQPGDLPRHIHWKGYARGQGLYTKRFAATTGGDGLLDWFAVSAPDRESRIGILCHAVLNAERRKTAYGLRLPDRLIRPAVGLGHRHRCLEALACMPGAVRESP